MLTLGGLLTPQEVQAIADRLAEASFVDGVATAQGRAAAVKRNLQLPVGSDVEQELGARVLAALNRSELFKAAVLPSQLVPIRFSRYDTGMEYGWHVDAAVMPGGGGRPVRSDLACTIFLSDPASYTGGELTIQTPVGQVQVKLGLGDAVIYPATYLHRVEPVTHGVRLVSLTWIQSLVAAAEQRQVIFDLIQAVRELQARDPGAAELDRLQAVHQNLIRLWSHP